MLSRMPSPHGKDIEDFLMEYKHFADHANWTNERNEKRLGFTLQKKREMCVRHTQWVYSRELEKLEEGTQVPIYLICQEENASA